MPYIDPLMMPPQKGPKSARAVQAESNQAKAQLGETAPRVVANSIPHRANVGARRPFLKKLPLLRTVSIFDWKMDPKEISEKLHGKPIS